MVRVALLVVVLMGAFAGRAGAVTLVTEDGQVAQPEQRWANSAKVPTFRGRVRLVRDISRCVTASGGQREACAEPGEPPTIYFGGDKYVLLHELGHVFDYAVLNDAERSDFLRLLREPRRPWRDSPNSPHEQFAEGYAYCALYRHVPMFLNPGPGFDYPLWSRIHPKVCDLIRQAGGWAMRPVYLGVR